MSDETTVTFDFSRVLDLDQYGELDNPIQALAFSNMVRDYTEYARSQPKGPGSPPPTPVQAGAAARFADAIQSRKGWPLARQVVSEFKNPPNHLDDDDLPGPVRHALGALRAKGLLDVPPMKITESQKWEEELYWRKWQAYIRYIAWHNGTEIADEQRHTEVNEAWSQISDAIATVNAVP